MATRVFTKNIGRYKIGDIREYPIPTWQQIERTTKTSMEKFSKPIDDAVQDSLQSRTGSESIMRRGKA